MNILVLGANGFIGSRIVLALVAAGHDVTGLVRRAPTATPLAPVKWTTADIARLRAPADWTLLLSGIDVVVNCAGALQSGVRDDVTAVQQDAIIALIDAAGTSDIRLFVNNSAPLEGSGAETEFLATKRAADTHLAASKLPHVILRPALVIGRNAHGGSALIRALAAFPGLMPAAFPETKIRIAGVDDVANAVVEAIAGKIAPGSDCTIATQETYTLAEVLRLTRRWLGLAKAPVVAMPAWSAALAGHCADFLGLLGWRSPMRSTAMLVAGGGIADEASAPKKLIPASSLQDILAAVPAGVQDLWFARLYLLKSIVFGVLSLFWIVSGVIALIRFDQTAGLAREFRLEDAAGDVMTAATALIDILVGVGIAVRRWARTALVASLLMSAFYLVGASFLAPALWLDPLGVLVKIFPAMVLAVVALVIFPERA